MQAPASPPTRQRDLLIAVFVAVVVIGWVVMLLAPILTPFAVSMLLAYLGDPWADALERRGLSRTTAVAVVFALILSAMLLVPLILVPLLSDQVRTLMESTPRYVERLAALAGPWLKQNFDIELHQYLSVEQVTVWLRQYWQQIGEVGATVVQTVTSSGMALLGLLLNLTLIPVLTFYLLRDFDLALERIRELLPRRLEPTISQLARESDAVLAAFVRGQLSVMVLLGLIYTAGLMLVGIDLALLIGMGAGLISFVPYLGGIVGFGAALIAALVQHGDLTTLLLVLAVFAVGQTIEGFMLTPWLVGESVGLHPVAVMFAVMAGGQLFGFVGVLLALPVAAVLVVLARYAHQRYVESELYRLAQPDSAVTVPDQAPAPAAPNATDPT